MVLHYGLILGAVFQLIALAAIIFLPSKHESDEETISKPAVTDREEDSDVQIKKTSSDQEKEQISTKTSQSVRKRGKGKKKQTHN